MVEVSRDPPQSDKEKEQMLIHDSGKVPEIPEGIRKSYIIDLAAVPFRVALVARTFAFIRSQPKVSARKSGQMCHQSVFQLSSLLYRSPKLSRISGAYMSSRDCIT
ncbi:hypothetical protein CDAR_600381 [Caerostris darwini]|uniref:Uncharacterized protein n=1 Tax=Caerostris darwini TaxID=1538125 RepID=A0AAV4TW81_9ARAC|nr:hypothetical protein CDAR_600381 [Caerostris darwini]